MTLPFIPAPPTTEIIRDILADPTARVRERQLAERALELEEAIQANHDTRYGKGHAARAVFSPADVALFEAAGIVWNRPPPWQPTPDQREAWRRDPGAAKREREIGLDPVRVDIVPEQLP